MTNVPKRLVWHQRVDRDLATAHTLHEHAIGAGPGRCSVRIDQPTETSAEQDHTRRSRSATTL